ncbi:hypothetical protein GON03_08000 [Nocardioides sp. MAH-18]|uniref:HTH luxR-type domain-containing protein n=1 Tax=Nocardioides agri TaxID=2682843 RepID=A0A6L6XQQ3_9ACTN|nr:MULTISPECIES: LuxR C-terminal-related transcriptional regulator [unclassified Nocardioides]MBA2954261.1 hypothetical protein [Nocardioides sp. CGMCC 1.13656]MVQ49122.1 hypothetical protein [Nocardioides sp. MAH-18]
MTTPAPTTDRRRKRVVVVGQFTMVVEAVSRSLPATVRTATVALDTAPSTNAARDSVLRSSPALVVLVVSRLDRVYAPDLVSELAGRGQRVVVIGQVGDAGESRELAAAGAMAVLDGVGATELVRLVARLTDPEAGTVGRTRVAVAPRRAPDAALTEERRALRRLARLTPAEARTLWRLMHGDSVLEIAERHVVSVETVRSHIRALLTKLDASSQLAAVALAWRVGWQSSPAVRDAA